MIPLPCFDSVVAIGIHDKEGIFKGIASGFLYGDYVSGEGEKKLYRTFLVTNRHVFEGLNEVFLRFNPKTQVEPAHDYLFRLVDATGKAMWAGHPRVEIDVAVAPISVKLLLEQGMRAEIICSDENVADIQKMNELGIMEGDGIYVLGFPLGIVGKTRNAVIARSGTIARIQDALSKENAEYLIDAFVFPGNSGSPVILKVEFSALGDTKPQNRSYVIGIVKQNVSYVDEAYSKQTGEVRVVFQDNSGLAVVHPIDFINEIIQTIPKAEMPPPPTTEKK